MKRVILYQIKSWNNEWLEPQAYVPTDEDDYERCKALSDDTDTHLIKTIEVEDDVQEINLRDHLSKSDDVYNLDRWYYLIS